MSPPACLPETAAKNLPMDLIIFTGEPFETESKPGATPLSLAIERLVLKTKNGAGCRANFRRILFCDLRAGCSANRQRDVDLVDCFVEVLGDALLVFHLGGAEHLCYQPLGFAQLCVRQRLRLL